LSESVYTASAWGQRFHARREREVFGAGAAGPGKSLVLLADALARIQIEHWRCLGEVPNPHVSYADRKLVLQHKLRWGQSQGWALHLRRAMPMLEQTQARAARMFRAIDPDVQHNSQKHIYTFRSGYKYQFGHCLDRDSWQQYDSQQYDWIGYDELVQFEKNQYDSINVRLRSGDPLLRQILGIRGVSNPVRVQESNISIEVNDPNWVRRRFVDPCPSGNRVLRKKMRRRDGTEFYRDRIFLPATLYDNPDPVFRRQYEEELLDKPAHIRQAMLYGNWYINAGSFYGEDWDETIHVCRPFKVPLHWRIFRSMDWGFKTSGCVGWWAFDDDGNLLGIRELKFRFKNAEEVAIEIREIEKTMGLWVGNRSGISGPADTQIWEDRGDTGLTKAAEFAAVGVHWLPANKKSRARNAEHFTKRLRDHENKTAVPGVRFFSTMSYCIQSIPGIQIDINNPEEPVKGGDDHGHDMVCYAASYASRGPSIVPPLKSGPESAFEGPIEKKKVAPPRVGFGNGVI